MFPMLLLSAFAGYQYAKNKEQKKINAQLMANSANKSSTKTSEDSTAKNVYNYYTNASENGTTLFGQEKKTKRQLFDGNDTYNYEYNFAR